MRPLSTTSAAIALLGLLACDNKPDSAITPSKEVPSAPVASAPTPTVVPSTPTPTEGATASVAATTSAPPAAAPSSSVTAFGRAKDGGASTAALKPASKRVTGNNFALDVASPGCRAGEECAMTIKLAASGEYHVNKEYPYKFIATPAAGVAFLGKTDPNTFTKASGDFVEQGEKSGLMTVRFKPASAGEAKVAGKYKLSVCSADQCLIEEPMIELAVPVL